MSENFLIRLAVSCKSARLAKAVAESIKKDNGWEDGEEHFWPLWTVRIKGKDIRVLFETSIGGGQNRWMANVWFRKPILEVDPTAIIGLDITRQEALPEEFRYYVERRNHLFIPNGYNSDGDLADDEVGGPLPNGLHFMGGQRANWSKCSTCIHCGLSCPHGDFDCPPKSACREDCPKAGEGKFPLPVTKKPQRKR